MGIKTTDQEYLYGIRGQIILEILFMAKQILSANSISNCTNFCPEIFHNIFPGSDKSSLHVDRVIDNFAQVIAVAENEEKLPCALLIL